MAEPIKNRSKSKARRVSKPSTSDQLNPYLKDHQSPIPNVLQTYIVSQLFFVHPSKTRLSTPLCAYPISRGPDGGVLPLTRIPQQSPQIGSYTERPMRHCMKPHRRTPSTASLSTAHIALLLSSHSQIKRLRARGGVVDLTRPICI